jgi:very-short-patch-repair endonuclease
MQESIELRTDSERLLAKELGRRGILFRSNYTIYCSNGRTYVVDFLLERNLVVEVMGRVHWKEDVRTKDVIRREALRSDGYLVLEFLNIEVFCSVRKVADSIVASLTSVRTEPVSLIGA